MKNQHELYNKEIAQQDFSETCVVLVIPFSEELSVERKEAINIKSIRDR